MNHAHVAVGLSPRHVSLGQINIISFSMTNSAGEGPLQLPLKAG